MTKKQKTVRHALDSRLASPQAKLISLQVAKSSLEPRLPPSSPAPCQIQPPCRIRTAPVYYTGHISLLHTDCCTFVNVAAFRTPHGKQGREQLRPRQPRPGRTPSRSASFRQVLCQALVKRVTFIFIQPVLPRGKAMAHRSPSYKPTAASGDNRHPRRNSQRLRRTNPSLGWCESAFAPGPSPSPVLGHRQGLQGLREDDGGGRRPDHCVGVPAPRLRAQHAPVVGDPAVLLLVPGQLGGRCSQRRSPGQVREAGSPRR